MNKKATPRIHPAVLSIALIVALTFIVFRQFFLNGLLPIPYNILVGWYFPYNIGGWSGYYPGIVFKGGLFAADVFRQMIPWKLLSLDLIRSGQLPLWNPYNFSGEPLLANIQTTIFSPFSLLFLATPNFDIAWSWYIILCPFLGTVFMLLFLRSLNLSFKACLIGALAFGFSGRMLTWLEWGVVTHSIVWLPLILFALHHWLARHHRWALPILIVATVSTILGGYPQESAYALFTAGLFFLYIIKSYRLSIKTLRLPIFMVGLIVGLLVAPQIIPTAKLFAYSVIKGQVSTNLYLRTRLSPWQLVTAFAPDYFGNRITGNYWADTIASTDYLDANLFIGSVALIFFFLSLFISTHSPSVKKLSLVNYQPFFRLILLVSLLFAIKSPLTYLFGHIRLPALTTGSAGGITTITVFCLAVLSSYGLDKYFAFRRRRPLLIVAAIYLLLILTSILVPGQYRLVTLRNLVIPTTTALAALLILWSDTFLLRLRSNPYKALLQSLVLPVLICLIVIETSLYARKMLSFSPPDYSYPQHLLIWQLQNLSSQDYSRTMGFWEGEISTNLDTQFHLFSAEGYNPLQLLSYQQLISSGETGIYDPTKLKRSDADFPVKNETNRNRLLDLTSIKYIPAKVTDPGESWEQEPLKYHPDRFQLIWQAGLFKIYQNLFALPRVSLFNRYQVIDDISSRIATLFSPNWDPHSSIVLEHEPAHAISLIASGSAKIISYTPNQVDIVTNTQGGNSLLLLTDSYYPSWHAYIDNQQTTIYKANQTFRAIIVPEGIHQITYKITWP